MLLRLGYVYFWVIIAITPLRIAQGRSQREGQGAMALQSSIVWIFIRKKTGFVGT